MAPSRRSFSLQARVAVASALAATIVIAAICAAFVVFLQVNERDQIDRALSAISLSVPTDTTAAGVLPPGVTAATVAGPASMVRAGEIDGTEVRARDIPIDGADGQSLEAFVPQDAMSRVIRDKQWQIAIVAVVAVAVAAGLGWLFAGRAVRPLQRLAAATRDVGHEPTAALPQVRGTREAEELSDAIAQMLARLDIARERTQEALGAARDFAAVSAHELRTPLTAMRTDLEVLSTLPLTEEQRIEVLGEVIATQRQVEKTLTDLERLAVGELSDPADDEEFDLVELADRCVQEMSRRLPQAAIELRAPASLTMTGLPSGLRMVLENAVANAARHGRADRIRITITGDSGVGIVVDDNGIGVPEHERTSLFSRFARGAAAHAEGSGLGLALIAQQAQLHGGHAELAESELGGASLRVALPMGG